MHERSGREESIVYILVYVITKITCVIVQVAGLLYEVSMRLLCPCGISRRLDFAHEAISDSGVYYTTDAKRRDDPTYARQTALEPIDPDFPKAVGERGISIPVIPVQAEQMQWRGHELDARRRQELRD